jgi:hypothetical protein
VKPSVNACHRSCAGSTADFEAQVDLLHSGGGLIVEPSALGRQSPAAFYLFLDLSQEPKRK